MVIACGNSDDAPTGVIAGTPPGGTAAAATYEGVLDTGLKGGIITLVATPAATGTLKVTGEPEVALAGNYDVSSRTFTVSGGAYSVLAAVDAPQLFGSLTIRGQLGTGTVAGLVKSATVPTAFWCGVTNGTSVIGIDLAVQGGVVVGVAQGNGAGLLVKGTASATDIQFSWSPGVNQTGNASAKISGTTMSGTWSNSFGGNGTWTAASNGC